MQVEAQRADAYVARAGRVERPFALSFVSAHEPTFKGPVDLHVPAELGVGVPRGGPFNEVERGVEVLEVVCHHHFLTVGVADVEVAVVHEEHGPLARGAHDDLTLAKDLATSA